MIKEEIKDVSEEPASPSIVLQTQEQLIGQMLSQPPTGAGPKQTKLWKRLKPLTVAIFQKYWDVVEPVKKMTDSEVASFETWTNEFER